MEIIWCTKLADTSWKAETVWRWEKSLQASLQFKSLWIANSPLQFHRARSYTFKFSDLSWPLTCRTDLYTIFHFGFDMNSWWNLCFRSIGRFYIEGDHFCCSPVLAQAKPNFSKLIFASWIWKHETKQSMAISACIFWRCNFCSRYYLSLIWGIRKNWEIAKRFNGHGRMIQLFSHRYLIILLASYHELMTFSS